MNIWFFIHYHTNTYELNNRIEGKINVYNFCKKNLELFLNYK